ncbi:MAG TPA: hypothetical protein PLR60_00665 [Syntrophorhabdaceae bacterium]|nr:hypothetical protein [Syntrophorhabdaceae bacterium]
MIKIFRSISRGVTPLNLILTSAVVLACVSIIFPVTRASCRFRLPQIVQKRAVPQEDPGEMAVALLPTDYAVVSEMNLFHPQRTVPIDVKAQLPKPELFLCGVIRHGNELVAFVEDKKNPTTSPGRGKRQTVLRKGSVYAGYSVMEINNDSIILTRGEQSVSVHLMDPDKRGGKNTGTSASRSSGSSSHQMPPSSTSGSPPAAREPSGLPHSESFKTSQPPKVPPGRRR